jgi:hypothetical protein
MKIVQIGYCCGLLLLSLIILCRKKKVFCFFLPLFAGSLLVVHCLLVFFLFFGSFSAFAFACVCRAFWLFLRSLPDLFAGLLEMDTCGLFLFFFRLRAKSCPRGGGRLCNVVTYTLAAPSRRLVELMRKVLISEEIWPMKSHGILSMSPPPPPPRLSL